MTNKCKKRPLTCKLVVTSSTSAGDAAKWNKTHNTTCPICEESFKSGHESIFCEGNCQKFIHRWCASLTKEQFKRASESDLPFYCLHCITLRQNFEIDKLRKLVSELTTKISTLVLQTSPVSDGQDTTSVSKATNSTKQQPLPKIEQSNDRKYKLVLYRISECSKMGLNVQRELSKILRVPYLFCLILMSTSKQTLSDTVLDWVNLRKINLVLVHFCSSWTK